MLGLPTVVRARLGGRAEAVTDLPQRRSLQEAPVLCDRASITRWPLIRSLPESLWLSHGSDIGPVVISRGKCANSTACLPSAQS